jgi:1,4-dihydroxy-2-naphthoyl-CoA hydrolase
MSNMSDEQSTDMTDITAEVRSFGMGALSERMGIEIVSATIDSKGLATISATMPVEGNTQPYGLLHGGASAVLAETVGSIASAITAHRRLGQGAIVVGIDLNCTHHKSARDGIVTGVAHMISVGNTMLSSEIVITNSEGERICTSRLTAMARKPRP